MLLLIQAEYKNKLVAIITAVISVLIQFQSSWTSFRQFVCLTIFSLQKSEIMRDLWASTTGQDLPLRAKVTLTSPSIPQKKLFPIRLHCYQSRPNFNHLVVILPSKIAPNHSFGIYFYFVEPGVCFLSTCRSSFLFPFSSPDWVSAYARNGIPEIFMFVVYLAICCGLVQKRAPFTFCLCVCLRFFHL